jgi:hypothetical protein
MGSDEISMAKSGKVGRPTKPGKSGERVPLGLRVTAKLKSQLDEAFKTSGRSQSQEAEFRLERSFDRQDLLTEVLSLAFGDNDAELLLAIAKNKFGLRDHVYRLVYYLKRQGGLDGLKIQAPPTDEEFEGMLKRHKIEGQKS